MHVDQVNKCCRKGEMWQVASLVPADCCVCYLKWRNKTCSPKWTLNKYLGVCTKHVLTLHGVKSGIRGPMNCFSRYTAVF